MSRYNDNDEKFKSIRSNTISEQLYADLREDYGFPPAVCRVQSYKGTKPAMKKGRAVV